MPSKSQKNGIRSRHCEDAFRRAWKPKRKRKKFKPNKAITPCWHGHGQGKSTGQNGNKEILDEFRGEIAAKVRVRGTGREALEEPAPKRARPHRVPSTNLDNKFVAHEQEQAQRIPQGERRQGHEQVLGTTEGRRATERTEYACPYCQEKTYSSVRTGKVQVAGHCGKQFRVRNGFVVRSFTHACPRCGTEAQSAKASGRIQSQHKKPNGKACPTTEWVGK